MNVHPDSVLFVTLDSCRFDTFLAASAPNMKAVAPLHSAQAPSHFTYGSHAAMFVGFTPSIPGCKQPIFDNKFAKLFKMRNGGFSIDNASFELIGRNVIEGFRRRGYKTIGSGAVGWFDPNTETGQLLSADFDQFFYAGISVGKQVEWMKSSARACEYPLFCFLNVGETHVPYWHEGASWSRSDNPCVPYSSKNSVDNCRERQRSCCEYVDGVLKEIIDSFLGATILICADHGDCWGEDNLWEHGVSHSMTLTVPLLIRLRGEPLSQSW
jgi:hypothetical protein